MNEINGGSFRVSWKEDGVYQETLYLLDEEEIPVLRSCPYASVFSDSRMYYPYLQEGTKLVSAAVTNQAAGASGLYRHPKNFFPGKRGRGEFPGLLHREKGIVLPIPGG